MRVLFIGADSFFYHGVKRAFDRLDISYDVFEHIFINLEHDDMFCEILHSKLKDNAYDIVLSAGFFPLAANVCQTLGVRYYSWVYDNMRTIGDMTPILNDCCEVFFFDRIQAEEYAMAGVHAHYLPLAADTEVFEETINALPCTNPAEDKKIADIYFADTYFAGETDDEVYGRCSSMLEPYLRGYLEGIVNAQSKLYGAYIIPELVGDDLVEAVNTCCRKGNESSRMGRPELEYMLADETTRRERQQIKSILEQHYNIVSKQYDMKNSAVLANSRINLNATHKSIRSGITLNVLEIMACGGFVLTNYQDEIAEYLRPGEACVMYESMEDMYEKASFYLSHGTERKRIAAAGKELIRREFTFEKRIRQMLAI